MDDSELIYRIKKNIDSENSLKNLHDKHSGIFFKMINSYVPNNCEFADKEELLGDSKYYIYCAALEFNSSKGAKFSTFLGNKTRWMCLNLYNKNKKQNEIPHEDFLLKIQINPSEDFLSSIMKRELIEKVFESIEENGDKRIEEIFRMRYIVGYKNKEMPWRKISQAMGLSIQGCINIHDSFVERIKKKNIKQKVKYVK